MIRYKKLEGENPLFSLPNLEELVWLYDIEVAMNLFCVSFRNTTTNEIKQFEISERKNESKELIKFILTSCAGLIGYNNIFYDDPMLAYGINKHFKPSFMYEMSQKLINGDKNEIIKIPIPKTWLSLDLMKLAYLDQLGISLKDVAIRLKMPLIQDLPFKWNEPIPIEAMDLVLRYNLNDISITHKLWLYLQDEIALRIETENEYGFDCVSLSRPSLAKELLRHLYLKPKGISRDMEKHLKTYRNSIKLSDVIADTIAFKTNEFKALLEEIRGIVLYPFKTKFTDFNYKFPKKTIFYGNKKFDLMTGGLHSQDDAGIFVADDKYVLIDLDVASFYPMIVKILKIFPAHLGEDFVDVFVKMIDERLSAKRKKLSKAEILKIVINSIFGMFNSEYSFLYDPICMLKTTINGQLYLLMLIEMLVEDGFEIISSNTDGITIKCPIDRIEECLEIGRGWQSFTGFDLELDRELSEIRKSNFITKLIRMNVNNYIAIYENGKTKTKGDFVTEIQIQKGYDAPIVSKAMYAYFVEGKNYKEFVKEDKDIYDFCMAQKVDKRKFNVWMDDKKEIIPLTKTNRYYASENGGRLFKKRIVDGGELDLTTELVLLANDIQEGNDIGSYNINYYYYQNRIKKIIDIIESNDADKKFKEQKKIKKVSDLMYKKEHQMVMW